MTSEQTIGEAEQKDELLFALHHRDTPTVVFLECNSYAKREELACFLRQNLTEYRFKDVDVTRFSVVSLLRTLTENLSEEVIQSTSVQYVVNVHGLENSLLLSEDGQIKPSLLTAQLNLERELLFRNVPYIIIIWADHLFFQTLQRESPDFWSWVVYRFRFEGPEVMNPENAPPLPPKRLPQRGDITERKRRIEELETTYNQLNLNTNDKKRLLKDKVTILTLLAEEYTEAFRHNEAQSAYENAIAIAGRMQEDNLVKASLFFGLAKSQSATRQYSKALTNYENCLSKAKEDQYNIVYHYIGTLYAEQHQWQQALSNYRLALEWNQKTNNAHNKFEEGNTYHQIGMVYEGLQQWTQALTNYQLALKWKEKRGNTFELGSTYHNIGMLYAGQQRWIPALTNYQLALEWNQKTGNVYEVGGTYHQIGNAYAEHKEWQQALNSYQLALDWNQKTGNAYEVGGTYHTIGMIHAEGRQWQKALANYKLAIEWNERTGRVYELGRSYHQIGIVYSNQQQWTQALTNYQSALEWNGKTGNTYELGSTYHQIGAVHEEQNDLEEAVRWYRLAIDTMTTHGREDQLPIAQGSLVRVESQLASQ
ncbi:MAG: tetratricopeptide repeat protein [Bacteroidetes bacterium]|nr:tetratricopeptide repeat protein [Fibrella sp.]